MANPYFTNRGLYKMLGYYFGGDTAPSSFKLALCLAATAPNVDKNTLSELSEIAVGNGYNAGGASVARSLVGFDTLTEDDSNDLAYIQLQTVTWVATGGSLPSSGNGARYAVLVDSSSNIVCWWDFVTDRMVTIGQDLQVIDAQLQLKGNSGAHGMTNRGLHRILGSYCAAQNAPTGFKLALCTAATTPTFDINTLSDLTEIAAGNGYSAGGAIVARNLTTGFSNWVEDDTADKAGIDVRPVSWVASGGPIPASGSGARYAVLVDQSNNALCWWDFVTERIATNGETLSVPNCKIEIAAAA